MNHPHLSVVAPPVMPSHPGPFGSAVPYGQPYAPAVTTSTGAGARLDELRDLLAAFCLLEASKYFQASKNTPANVATVREVAHLARAVLAIAPGSNPDAGNAEFDFGVLSAQEAEAFYQLREKARAAGRSVA